MCKGQNLRKFQTPQFSSITLIHTLQDTQLHLKHCKTTAHDASGLIFRSRIALGLHRLIVVRFSLENLALEAQLQLCVSILVSTTWNKEHNLEIKANPREQNA